MELFAEQDAKSCSAKRLPRFKFPVYNTTLEVVIPAGATEVEKEFEAERDTVFTSLSVGGDTGDVPNLGPRISATYCNTVILDDVFWYIFKSCCLRKPIFLQEVRNKKQLKFTVRLPAPIGTEQVVKISLQGFQGVGCCD